MLAPNPAMMPQAQPGAQGAMPMQPPAPQPPQVLHDVVVKRSRKAANCKIEPVPPEEFGISRNARSIPTCDYCFHKVLITQAKAIAQGYDEEHIKAIPTYTNITNTEEIQRDTVNEYQYTGDEGNPAARRIEITEHYALIDYEQDDNACLYKITTGGHQSLTILKKDGKLDIEPIDAIPFAAMTPVIVTHRFFGRSIADLVMDIQRIKTALMRAVLDNAYLANNPRVEVAENFAGPDTLDDLLVSRPGGIVRTKQPGGIQWQTVPSIAQQVFPIIEYMDTTRETRTGVTRQGQGIGADALQNQSATAVSQVYTAAQARIRLIARIFAETGIRDMFTLIHATIRKHGQEAKTVRLRNQWVSVDPREWKTRNDMTIHVGLGQGSKSERMAHLTALGGIQKELLLGGKTNLVSDKNLYSTAKETTRLLGLPNVDDFFTDPATQAPPQASPNPDMIKMQMEQQKAQDQIKLQAIKAEADAKHQMDKTQAEMALEQMKFEHEKQLSYASHALSVEKQRAEIAHRQAMGALEIQLQAQKNHMDAAAKAGAEGGGVGIGEDGKPMLHPQIIDAFKGLAQQHADSHHAIITAVTAPRKTAIHRDPKTGRVSHAVSTIEKS